MSDFESGEEHEFEVSLDGQIFTRLTEIVRNQYLKFLKKQLENNLLTCCGDENLKDENGRLERLVQKCAQNLEDSAIKEATITQLYQRAMVKTIDIVRCCTQECRLLEEMQTLLTSNEPKAHNGTLTATKATQTENYEEPPQMLSLDERIDSFQKHLNQKQNSESQNLATDDLNPKYCREQRKRRTSSSRHCNDKKRFNSSSVSNKESELLLTPIWHSPTPPPQTDHVALSTLCKQPNELDQFEEQLAGDEVAEELEKLFMEQETDLEEIFGISLENNVLNCDIKESIANEIFNDEQSQTPQTKAAVAYESIENSTISNIKKNDANLPTNTSNQIFRQPVSDLRHSPWPCECFMQKRRLSATLTRMVEEDIRWFDILKVQFTILFGVDDSHDDFAPCSPSLELDENIIGSCMRRISPWVVKNLMKPLQDGLIGNRFLFKKLAKKLAFRIITENQYPNELVIRTAVENFFCLHRTVMTVDDLNDIDTMAIVEFAEKY